MAINPFRKLYEEQPHGRTGVGGDQDRSKT